jgi:APA family basic amino acid/polyamine antiporter
LFYILTVFALFLFRFKKPTEERPYKVWGYPFVPAIYILLASAICISLLVYKPNYTYPGLGIVLLGVPVYYWFARKSI